MTPLDKKPRIVKRYQNRKLYDTSASRYVTLDDIANLIQSGDDVNIIDNRTQDDLTAVTLAQIIFEQEKKNKSLLPLPALKDIIHSGGGTLVQFFQKSLEPAVSSISHARDEAERYIDKIIKKGDDSIDEVRSFIDEKVKSTFENVSSLPSVQTEMRSLRKKIELLEKRLKKYEK
jgi:polyhydroxyalkanoate synthesis repressor PhaR